MKRFLKRLLNAVIDTFFATLMIGTGIAVGAAILLGIMLLIGYWQTVLIPVVAMVVFIFVNYWKQNAP